MKTLEKFTYINKAKVISCLLGLIITLFSMTLYAHYQSVPMLIGLLLIINLGHGYLQLYRLYFSSKAYGRSGQIVLSLLASIVFVVIIFMVLVLVYELIIGIPYNLIDLIFYAVFLLPSFVIVIAVLLVVLAIIGS